jgi:hypothetical protein
MALTDALSTVGRGAAGAGAGGLLGQGLNTLSQGLNFPRELLIRPLLERLGLPGTGADLARMLDPQGYSQPLPEAQQPPAAYPEEARVAQPIDMPSQPEPGILAKALGMGYDMLTDPLSYLGMVGGGNLPRILEAINTGKLARAAETMDVAGAGLGKMLPGSLVPFVGAGEEAGLRAAPSVAETAAAAERAGAPKAMEAIGGVKGAYEAGQLGSEPIRPGANRLGPYGPFSSGPDPNSLAVPTLSRALEPQGQIRDILNQVQQAMAEEARSDIAAGPISQYAQDYMAHIPELQDVMQNPTGRLYRRMNPEATNILEGAGLGRPETAGFQTVPGFRAPESLVGGRGGVMFPRQPGLPTDIYARHSMELSPMEVLEQLRQLAAQEGGGGLTAKPF